MNKKIPSFIAEQYKNGAQGYRVQHRKALKTTAKALQLAMSGCAYAPSYQHLMNACEALNAAIEAARPGNWERAGQGKPEGTT